MKRPHTKNTLLQAATSQPTNQRLQESIFSSAQEKLKNKKIPSRQRNKTSQPHNPRQISTLKSLDVTQMDTAARHRRRRESANPGFASGGVTCKLAALCLYSSSVLVDSFVLRNPHERKARNRYTHNILLNRN